MNAATSERPELRLYVEGRKGGTRGAVLVLEGARGAELRRACALAGLISDSCILVAVDGGLKTCRAGGRRPDLYVGDRDSVSRVPPAMPSVVFDRDKDFNDLAGAFSELRKRDVQVVTVAGLLGGRLDHEWANLQELGSWARHFAGILAPSERGTVLVTSRGCRTATVRDQIVSLLVLGSSATVSLQGTRWTLRHRRIRPGSLGLSNKTGKSLRLVVHSGTVALVFPSADESRPSRKRGP